MKISTEHNVPWFILSGILFLFFFFIYSVEFTFLPIQSAQIIVGTGLLAWTIRSLNTSTPVYIPYELHFVFLLWSGYFLWVLFRTVSFHMQDVGFLINSLILVLAFAGALLFSTWFYKKGFSLAEIIRFLQILIVLQAIFIIIYFFSQDFKEFTLLVIPEGGGLPALHPFRSRGLAQQSGAKLSALQATGILFTAYLFTKTKRWSVVLFDVMALCLLTASIMLTGRTGFFIFPFIAVFFVLHALQRKGFSRKILFSSVVFPVLVIGGFFVVEMLTRQMMGANATSAFTDLTDWVFEEMGELFTTGESRTTRVLLEKHLFFPSTVEGLLFGNPTTHSVNRVSSDIGYVRWIFGVGIVGAVLLYTLIITLLHQAIKYGGGVTEKLLILIFGFWIFTLEFKEAFVSDLRFSSITFLFFCYTCVVQKQKSRSYKLKKKNQK